MGGEEQEQGGGSINSCKIQLLAPARQKPSLGYNLVESFVTLQLGMQVHLLLSLGPTDITTILLELTPADGV